ncbi:MAG: gliding motility-associated C-terminal domain-containing protein [Bacteroidia bacterium]
MRSLFYNNQVATCYLIVFLLFLNVPISTFSQYNKNWILGNGAQVTFETNGPTVTPLPVGPCLVEAGTTVSDSAGKLLFYVDCTHFYDANHNPVYKHLWYPSTLIGNFASITQGVLAIPIPDSSNQYLVLTLHPNFVCGAIVPGGGMCLKSYLVQIGVSGTIYVKNQGTVFQQGQEFTEKMTAIKHADGKNWWIILHELGNNKFLFFKTEYGKVVYSHPQNIGKGHISDIGLGRLGYGGQIVASLDGKLVACAGSNNVLELFQFDRCDGILSNHNSIDIPDQQNVWYGVSFSKSKRFLYATTLDTRRLYQFEFRNQTTNRVLIDSFVSQEVGDVGHHLLGPDNNIYIGANRTSFSNRSLGVINSPDSLGVACKFVEKGLDLRPKLTYGHLPNLPNFDLGPLPLPPADAGVDHLHLPACFDTTVVLGNGPQSPDYQYEWSPAAGLDRVDSAAVKFNSSTLAPGESRRYILTVTDPSKGCRNVATDTVIVSRAPLPDFPLSPDISLCPDSTALLGLAADPTRTDWMYSWFPETGLATPSAAQTIITGDSSRSYTLQAMSPEGCMFEDTVEVMVLPVDSCVETQNFAPLHIPNVITPNGDGLNETFCIPELPAGSRLHVYDRWGVQVFYSADYQGDWPGTSSSLRLRSDYEEGVYYYALDMPDVNKRKVLKGWVLVLR